MTLRPHLKIIAEHPEINIIDVVATCVRCKKEQPFDLPFNEWNRWRNGELIQRCFPYLNDDAREILISGVCGECFDALFKEEEE